jgi:hypothetical protein
LQQKNVSKISKKVFIYYGKENMFAKGKARILRLWLRPKSMHAQIAASPKKNSVRWKKWNVHSNSVITNFRGPAKYVRYNRETL